VWKRRRTALYDHGYTVLPVVDAMTDVNANAHGQVGFIPRVARQAIQSMRAASKSGLGAEYTKAE
jgi:hypothetical protein